MVMNMVTGGMGFVGVYLARELLAQGEEVILFQRRRELPPAAADLKDRVKIVSGDISNWVHVVDAVKSNRIECIYHTAALLSMECKTSPATCFQVNVVGTFNVLESARMLGVSHVIYTSTGYAESLPPPKRFFDNTMLCPSNMYETTKFCSEQLGTQYSRQYDVDFRGLRLGMIIGPTRQISYYHGDYSGTIEKAAKGQSYTIHVDQTVPQNIIYVKDVALALIALKRAAKSKLRQQMYNAQGFTATMQEIATAVTKNLPNAQIFFDPDRSEEMRRACLADSYEMDKSSIEQDVGWQPKYPLEEAVLDFIYEVKEGRAG